MKRVILIATIVAFLVSPAFPCGAPQQIRGRVLADISGSGSLFVGVYLVTLELRVEDDPEPIAAVLSNPFGVFAFEPVLPCSAYTVTARHRFFSFGAPAQIEPKDFPPNGSGVAVTIVTVGQKNINKAIAL